MKQKKNGQLVRFTGMLIICLTLAAFVAIASGVGSKEDPLVTLSYLNDTYYDTILGAVDDKIAQRNTEMEEKIDKMVSGGENAAVFTVVTLSKNQVLTGDVGCEVMLRVGTATCVSGSTPGLIDTTGGSILENGASLEKNHLYMMTITDRGVKATAGSVKVLVRGGYTIS